MIWILHLILLPIVILTGAFVGSFANVCIYRLPWEKSVIWPPSNCPRCLTYLEARDSIPILGYLILRGRCRFCGASFSSRYAWVELLVALLFGAVYTVDVIAEPDLYIGPEFLALLGRTAFHACLLTLLVVATFIDYDLQIIPDSVTVTGMVIGLGVGWAFPEIRMEPAESMGSMGGLWVGLKGLLVGGGVIFGVRLLGSLLFRKEAMGLGDLTLMAMIGSFLGWQVILPTLFLGAITGLFHAPIRFLLRQFNKSKNSTGAGSEIPYGPYLSLGCAVLLLSWRWIWPEWLQDLYTEYGEVLRFLAGEVLSSLVK